MFAGGRRLGIGDGGGNDNSGDKSGAEAVIGGAHREAGPEA